jgi:hypothetical protein
MGENRSTIIPRPLVEFDHQQLYHREMQYPDAVDLQSYRDALSLADRGFREWMQHLEYTKTADAMFQSSILLDEILSSLSQLKKAVDDLVDGFMGSVAMPFIVSMSVENSDIDRNKIMTTAEIKEMQSIFCLRVGEVSKYLRTLLTKNTSSTGGYVAGKGYMDPASYSEKGKNAEIMLLRGGLPNPETGKKMLPR